MSPQLHSSRTAGGVTQQSLSKSLSTCRRSPSPCHLWLTTTTTALVIFLSLIETTCAFSTVAAIRSHSDIRRRRDWIIMNRNSESAMSPKRQKMLHHQSLVSPLASSSASSSDENPEDDTSPLLHYQQHRNGNSNGNHAAFIRGGHQEKQQNDPDELNAVTNSAGRLEELKQQETLLAAQLAAVRREKLATLQSRPLTIGVVGFGRFGQFIAKAFRKHGHNVVVTSRSDYTDMAQSMGATYVPLSNPQAFFDRAGRGQPALDVIVFCVSILSFEETVETMAPYIEKYTLQQQEQQVGGDAQGPLVVDVLSVKEHPRKVLLERLPSQVDLLLTHPMFGPDSGKNGWHGLNFVYEKTRINGLVLEQELTEATKSVKQESTFANETHHSSHHHHMERFVDHQTGQVHSVHENSEAHVEAVDRMERFLSIWEEEGCHMVPMSCRAHDAYAANSQFITHLMGRILGVQNDGNGSRLQRTPIDTSGFQSVLKLVESTTADSFELFYGLYKFNTHSADTIVNLQSALKDVVQRLHEKEQQEELEKQQRKLEKHKQQAK